MLFDPVYKIEYIQSTSFVITLRVVHLHSNIMSFQLKSKRGINISLRRLLTLTCAAFCISGLYVCFRVPFDDMMETVTKTNIIPKTELVTSFKTQAQKCERVLEFEKGDLLSQSKEDETLLVYFNGLCNGSYIEMGALDGTTFSNSWVFNKKLNWKGVLVELTPSNFYKAKKRRPNELAVVNAAVCEKKQKIHYYERGAVSGVYEFASPSFKKRRWKAGISLDSPQVKEIDCAPLMDILAENHVETNYFDFFSLDVEGAEFEVLKSIDFDKLGFGIIFVEADEHDPAKNEKVRLILKSNGYTYFSNHQRSDWFFNDQFLNIYKELWYP